MCSYELKKKEESINWDKRKREINDILYWGRQESKCSYDCIIPVSGGKDSHRQAFHVRDELGFHPLLVSCVYPPEELHERGASNLANLISNGFDCISLSLDPIMWKELMRHGFYRFGNFFAIGFKIPWLISEANTTRFESFCAVSKITSANACLVLFII